MPYMMVDEPLQPESSGIADTWAVREVDHLLHRVARYTKFVVFSKWFLAIVAVVLFVVLVVYPITEQRAGQRLSFVSDDVAKVPEGANASAPSMAKPVYEGSDAQGRPYRITGGTATQITADMIVIDKVEGEMQTNSGNVTVTADKAEYKQAANSIDLIGNVNVIDSKGYHFITPRAHVDTSTMTVTGQDEITGDGPMGKLLATGFEISDNARNIKFGTAGTRVGVTVNRGGNKQ